MDLPPVGAVGGARNRTTPSSERTTSGRSTVCVPHHEPSLPIASPSATPDDAVAAVGRPHHEELAVDVVPVPDPLDDDRPFRIVHAIEDAIVADS